MSIIETRNLTKYYGKSRGITNLDLTVEEGVFLDSLVRMVQVNPLL